MKNIGKITKAFMETLPQFSPGEKATDIFGFGKITPLTKPCLPSGICCPMCKGTTGFRIIDNSRIIWSCSSEKCIEENAKKTSSSLSSRKKTLSDFGIPKIYQNIKFSDLDQPEETQKIIDKFCVNFNRFLLLSGSSGLGKTFISCAIADKFIQEYDSCRFVNVADLYLQWLELKQNQKTESSLVEKFSECKLLILDDLGTRTPTEGFLDCLYMIINKRYTSENIGTIISTNMNGIDFEKKIGTPITSRIIEDLVIKMSGIDRRAPKF